MNWFDYLILAVVLGGAGLAIFRLIRQRKTGGCSGCSSDCANCAAFKNKK